MVAFCIDLSIRARRKLAREPSSDAFALAILDTTEQSAKIRQMISSLDFEQNAVVLGNYLKRSGS